MTEKKKKVRPKQDSEWAGMLFGWLFVLVGGLVIYALFTRIGPDGTLVCQDTNVDVSLTRFGTCRTE